MGKPRADGASLVVNVEFISIISKVLKYFKEDCMKTRLWLVTPNLNFGGIAPLKLIVIGKQKRVLDFIMNAEAENTPPEGMEVRDGQLVPKRVPREYWAELKNMCLWDLNEKPAPHRECILVREVFDTPETKNDADNIEETSP